MFKLFLTKYKKPLGILVTVLGALSSVFAIVKYYEGKGYNRAVTEIQAEANQKIAEATANAIEEHQEKVKQALEAQRIRYEAKIKQAEAERKTEEKIVKVIEYVDKIKIDPVCAIVSDDVFRLLNQTACAANGTCDN